jgi:16S rRNA G966 N2-methylase RsmD
VDSSPESLKIVKENLALCRFSAAVVRSDAVSFLSRGGKYDVIFIDPPYASDLYEKVLESIKLFDILSEGGIIVVESDRDRPLPDMDTPYRILRDYRYGKVRIRTYTRENQQ